MGTNQDDEIEIDLIELFYVLRRKIWIILLTGILGAVSFGLFTAMVLEPVFTSSTMLYIVNKTTTLTSLTDLQLGTQLTKDYKVLITSRPVTNQVISNLDLNMSHEQLVKKIKVENPADTRILTISVEDSDPYMAKSIADEVAKVASARMAQIMESALIILVLFIMNDTVKTPEDVEKYLGLNTLAAIPLFEENGSVQKKRRKRNHGRGGTAQ